ncbi:MAG: ribose transport system ATP-binding protein [Solirubrobacterales bacterium]|nr:ribose transport system ATP-binding protein [Solirubrobacterales bacterium]
MNQSVAKEGRAAGAPLVALKDVLVTFGGTVALDGVDFAVWPGEIVGLLGHNGAGKSTLVNVASGSRRPKRGTMQVNGEPVALRGDPRQMEHLGIKVIHQDPALAPNLSICDNILLGRDAERAPRAERRRIAREALALLDSRLNVDRPVFSLEFGERQIVDLARALSANLSVLFLDEPTGALGPHQTENLHVLLRKLAAEGHGLVYVSHRLRDIIDVCTRLVVLRGGKAVLDEPARGFSVAGLSEALAPGVESVRHERRAARDAAAKPTLTIERRGQRMSFGRGEIVGLFGMAAGPQLEVLSSLYGLGEPVEAELDGRPFSPRSPRAAIARNVYYVSADREREGLLPEMSALDNLVMPWLHMHTRRLSVSRAKATAVYRQAKDALDVRGGDMDAPVGSFSGGNRQKLVVGRWLFGRRPSVLLLSQPTQGVDVGARMDIARALRRLSDEGVAVVVASSEADEIALLCDRAFICEGDEWAESSPGEAWEERLLQGLMVRAA